uniref:Stannin n=1 Tax=Eptatretus burgeri TaxID=7764 RepID=A0A8C4NEA4_EPTBU
MTTLDHSPTTGIVTVIVIMMAVAALGTLLLGCWCCLRIWQGTPTPEDEESIVGDGVRKDPFLLQQLGAKPLLFVPLPLPGHSSVQ